jgi:spore coat polysaccharide biosynthesis predicted glycosyltransferase SpsG
MFALCIESSHQKGMGHFFRALNFISYLNSKNSAYIVFINNDPIACSILKSKNIPFETVNLMDHDSDWESKLILKYRIDIWINDRLDTIIKHAENVKKNNIKLVTFDDRGSGAELADIHIAALSFEKSEKLRGKRVLTGLEYLILNKEIERYRRIRKNCKNTIVTLGGSDTYGVTLKIIDILKTFNKKATIHIGPSFQHSAELQVLLDDNFHIISNVPSLVEVFYGYDLAITGGGLTPFEANASGLPCIIIANEVFEILNGQFLAHIGSSIFAGYYKDIQHEVFNKSLDIEHMSIAGIEHIKLDGVKKIYNEICQ